MRLIPVLVALSLLSFGSGCGLLIGNIRPVDEKSSNYKVLDLSLANPDWQALPSSASSDTKDDTKSGDVSDLTYQSKKNASIISLNSSCRPGNEADDQSLQSFTHQLLLGTSEISERDEKDLTVDGTPALQTTLTGKLNGQKVKLRTVVLRRGACVYDVMYLARPNLFSQREPDFNRFVESIKLK